MALPGENLGNSSVKTDAYELRFAYHQWKKIQP